MITNRLFVLLKKILYNKLYIGTLLFIIFITIIYQITPDSEKTNDIKVALYTDNRDPSSYESLLIDTLIASESIYTFYKVDTLEKLKSDIKTNIAHCGYNIPIDFFNKYLNREISAQIDVLTTPETVFDIVINETVFRYILSISASDLLYQTLDNNLDIDLPKETVPKFDTYDKEIFTVVNTNKTSYQVSSSFLKINIPIRKTCGILIFIWILLSIYDNMSLKEKGFWKICSTKSELHFKTISIIATLIPICIIVFFTTCINEGINIISLASLFFILRILVFSIISTITGFIIGFICKKSTILLMMLPMIFVFCLIFSNVFIDISSYSIVANKISKFLITSYF